MIVEIGCMCAHESRQWLMGWCGVHTCGVPTHGMKEWPLGPACLGTVWVGTVEWVRPSRADGCFSVNTWNKLGSSMKIFVTYQFHPKLHFNPTPLHPLACL